MTRTRSLLSAVLAACLAGPAAAVTVFSADFNASTPIDAGGGVVANATTANLDAGTSIGSWALSGSGGGDPGLVVADAGLADNAFVLDSSISGGTGNRITGLFTEAVDLSAGDTLSLTFQTYAARQGNGREVRLALQDSNGAVGGNAYVTIFEIGPTKGFSWLNTSNQQTLVTETTGLNTSFLNPNVDNYLSWSSGVPITVKIDVSGMPTLDPTPGELPEDPAVPATTGATISIDWGSDGSFDDAADGDVNGIDIGPRLGSIASIDRFELFYGGSGGNRGAYFDNFVAEKSAATGPTADLSGDGDVDDEDLGLFFSAFTGPDNGPSLDPRADLSGDGDVDDEDLGAAFSQFTGPLGPASVPEPTSLALLGLGGLLVARRRRD